MKFLAVLVLLGVSTLLVSAQSPTTSAPADTHPATGPDGDEAPEAATTAAATTTTTAAATTTTTAAPTTATTAASTTARKGILDLPKWLQDLLKGKVFP
ncbi:mucin-like protein 1 [Piliocolobus tephrosceles]|uniref:Mucin like 1 n=1 Tax=Piliocolobus tephrosceles TaxID=591936 RepID=A0A8C9IN28_9PRIM|nr:mucin-like protein 1 [Piliocolobus tephrosceles]